MAMALSTKMDSAECCLPDSGMT